MQSYAWLILWLPILGFGFNAVSGFLFKSLEAQSPKDEAQCFSR